MTPRLDLFALLAMFVLAMSSASADSYADARAELIAAYQAQDFPAMRQAATRAIEARPGYPNALFNRALAEILDGDANAAVDTLYELLGRGVDFGVAGIPEFEPLKQHPRWDEYLEEVERLYDPHGKAGVAFSYDASEFVPEGIAVVEEGQSYLGSIRHGTIVSIDEQTQVLSEGKEHWSVFGMRLDGNGGLWFASASVPQYAGENAEPGRTGLFHINLSNGEVDVRALLPEGEQAMVLGDLVIADEDTIYTTESLTGAVLRYSVSANEFTEIIASGQMRSAQGLVLDASGKHLYVADYVGGLFRIALADNMIEPVTAPDSISLYGIDGLYRYGNELIAIQNGIRPHRVTALELSADGLSVTASRVLAMNLPDFDEPTLGTVVGDEFYFVANSHWNRFDRDGNLPDGLAGPIVLKTELDDQR